MAGTRRRHGAVLLVAALVAGVLLVGCAPKSPSNNNGGGGSGQIGGAPSGTGTPSAGATTPGAAPTTPFAFPKDAKTYTSELLKAWGNKDFARIELLAQPATVQQIKDASNSPDGYPNSQWIYIKCAPGESAGTTECTWRNVNGDESVVRVTDSQLGHPVAVIQADLDRTRYPSDPVSYVGAFISAWQAGNQQRMAKLSSNTIKNYFIGQNPPLMASTVSIPVNIDSTYTRVEINGVVSDPRHYEFKVLKSPGGKANAIKAGCMTGCAV